MTEKYHEYTRNIICPYCGYEITDSWEYDNDSSEIECSECEKKFGYNRQHEITYSTHKLCETNKDEHEWSDWFPSESSGKLLRYCKGCNKIESKEQA